MTVVAATGNAHKLREMREILRGITLISEKEAGFSGEVEETGTTFLENALLKAHAVAEATRLAALADDSGLCVPALGGEPGVYSARYAALRGRGSTSADNRALLLETMQGMSDRRACFVCAVALVLPDGRELTAEGRTYGTILTEERGDNGFGYDPLFWSDELGCTFAEATEEAKNGVSHRGRALAALMEKL